MIAFGNDRRKLTFAFLGSVFGLRPLIAFGNDRRKLTFAFLGSVFGLRPLIAFGNSRTQNCVLLSWGLSSARASAPAP